MGYCSVPLADVMIEFIYRIERPIALAKITYSKRGATSASTVR